MEGLSQIRERKEIAYARGQFKIYHRQFQPPPTCPESNIERD